uniref:ABC transporter domain-containing protein n=1 Tax=Chromera velia CCMP2878 TaxID=1169474 RepID=A0A0G4H6L9_9ALVE|eukprot:Cvel_5753.t1-p1 / transcript=Cvel_5753.t1 / gene=Cvel_5753 / organism=Chromera_velia_CCMP2878 / gene_product=Uncharacterized ABC transporter ATP-binding protein, putative / transcript_product=Uncharacterized ABC transporter ATP-binding protein, putative / location=Cvel_scaffold273:46867-53848(-) / protein_length=838 / sequence_SO=supercontig / SO=protein_coding / is_pseudo=false
MGARMRACVCFLVFLLHLGDGDGLSTGYSPSAFLRSPPKSFRSSEGRLHRPAPSVRLHPLSALKATVQAVDLQDRDPLIFARDISKANDGVNFQFEGLTYTLKRGQKVALVGRNGAGKSTLMQVLSGRLGADSGDVLFQGSPSVIFVEQEPELEAFGETVRETVVSLESPHSLALKELEKANAEATKSPNNMAAKNHLEKALVRAEDLDVWGWESLVEKMVEQLNLKHLMDRPVRQLSGGERKRVALAAALAMKPDVLVLDEPTNHLDVFGIEWLQEQLAGDDTTVLFASHDRRFLNFLADELLELDEGRLMVFRGNYDDYLRTAATRREAESSELQAKQSLLKKELQWMSRQPRARQSRSKKRVEEVENLKAQVKASVQRMKTKERKMNLKAAAVTGSKRLGNTLIEVEDASLAFDEKVILNEVSLTLAKDDRIALVGPNGVGKSTFLKVLMGFQKLDSGSVKKGTTVQVGYYSQQQKDLPHQRVFDYLKGALKASASDEMDERQRALAYEAMMSKSVPVEMAMNNAVALAESGGESGVGDMDREAGVRNLLRIFNFPEARWYGWCDLLSGGEKRRLQLMEVLAQKPNILLMDEPTNDLDLTTITALEAFLETFEGALVISSHDRQFVDRVASSFLALEGEGEVSRYDDCTYDDYMDFVREKEELARKEKEREEKRQRERERAEAEEKRKQQEAEERTKRKEANIYTETAKKMFREQQEMRITQEFEKAKKDREKEEAKQIPKKEAEQKNLKPMRPKETKEFIEISSKLKVLRNRTKNMEKKCKSGELHGRELNALYQKLGDNCSILFRLEEKWFEYAERLEMFGKAELVDQYPSWL